MALVVRAHVVQWWYTHIEFFLNMKTWLYHKLHVIFCVIRLWKTAVARFVNKFYVKFSCIIVSLVCLIIQQPSQTPVNHLICLLLNLMFFSR